MGWKFLRLDCDMTRHDANILTFRQWWRRQVRSGYGSLEVYEHTSPAAAVHGGERLFGPMVASVRFWTIGWLSTLIIVPTLAAMPFGWHVGLIATGAIVLAIPVQIIRIVAEIRRKTTFRLAAAHAILTMIGKWAMVVGQMQYRSSQRKGRA